MNTIHIHIRIHSAFNLEIGSFEGEDVHVFQSSLTSVWPFSLHLASASYDFL